MNVRGAPVDVLDQILRRCQKGDQAAYSAIVRKLQEPIFRLAWRMMGDAALAEEAAAQVFVKLWTKARQWSGKSAARTWIYRLAVRTILDVQRGQRRWWRRWAAGPSAPVVDHRPGPVEQIEQTEERQTTASRIQEALAQLGAADRALVHLYYFENHALADIEIILGVGRDALKTRLVRARQRLRNILETDHARD